MKVKCPSHHITSRGLITVDIDLDHLTSVHQISPGLSFSFPLSILCSLDRSHHVQPAWGTGTHLSYLEFLSRGSI